MSDVTLNSSDKQDLFGVCPFVTMQKLLSGKWTIYILYLLSKEKLRFNEMQRRMPETITHTSLSRQLKTLEEHGLIIREDFKEVPPKVEYSLSPIGEQFKPVLESLKNWGFEYIKNN